MTRHAVPEELPALFDDIKAAQLPPPPERRRIREAAGVSCREAARVLGVSPMTVVHWEEGRTPRHRSLAIRYRKLLDALEEVAS